MMGMARSMLKAMGVPSWLWGEVVNTAVYILNWSPTRSVEGKTPFEVWFGTKPPVPMVFVGYEPGTKASRFYNPANRCAYMSRDAVFEEHHPWNWSAEQLGDNELLKVEFISIGGPWRTGGGGAAPSPPLSLPSSSSSRGTSPGGALTLAPEAEPATPQGAAG